MFGCSVTILISPVVPVRLAPMNDAIDDDPCFIFKLEQYSELPDAQPILRREVGQFLYVSGQVGLQSFLMSLRLIL